MIGRITLSLKALVADEMAHWRGTNSAFKRLRGGWSERWMYAATTNVGRLLRYWCVAAVFLLIAAYVAQIRGWLPAAAPTTDTRLDRILTIQATLAALTYPIVLALVGILLQRTWSDLRIRVYVAYSGALLAGASSLLLVGVLVAYLSVLRASTSPYLDAWLSNAVILWLLINIGLTAFFLVRSLRYLTPDEQQQALLQYTAEVLWPRELERRLLQLRWQSAPSIGWPPNENDDTQPMIGPSVLGLSDGDVEIDYGGQTVRWLANVRLRPLLWVTHRWKRRCRTGTNAHRAWLTFPIGFEQAIESADALCRRSGGSQLDVLDRILVRSAFRLRTSAPPRAHLSLAGVMDELGDAALSSINDGRVNSFARALSELLEFHRIAIQLGSVQMGSESANYLEMANHPMGGMQTLHARLLNPYRKLAQRLIDNADNDFEALQDAAHSADALLSHVRATASLEIREQLVFIAGFQWGALRARRHRSAEPALPTPKAPEANAWKTSRALVDERIVRTLCGAWDSIAFQVLRREDLNSDWELLAQRGKESVHFLERTTSHLLRAVADDDRLVARWALDLVQRWVANWFLIIDEHAIWEEFPHISEGALELPWERIEQALGIGGEELRSDTTKKGDVFAEVLLNAWRDSCGFLVTWLMAQTRDGDPRQAHCRSLLSALVSGEALEGSGSMHSVRQPFEHFESALASWIRANLLDSGEPNLSGGLWGRIARAADDSTGRPWVSGRAYGSGDDGEPVDLTEAALLRLLIRPVTEPRIGQALSDATVAFARQDAASAEGAERRLMNAADLLSAIDLTPWLTTFQLIEMNITIEDIDARRTQLAGEFVSLRDRICAKNAEHLDQRELDQAHLLDIAAACNRTAFSRETGGLPLPYFDLVESADFDAEEFTLTLPHRNKAELVDPPLATRASNELEWYEKVACDYVALDIRRKLIAHIQPTVVTVESLAGFADALDAAASELNAAGLEALLFIANRGDLTYRWRLDRSVEDTAQLAPMQIQKHEGYAHPGYLFHANGVPAILMPLRNDAAFLIPRESFEAVRFALMPNGNAGRLDINEAPEHRVALALVWGAQVDLRKMATFEFRLVQPKTDT